MPAVVRHRRGLRHAAAAGVGLLALLAWPALAQPSIDAVPRAECGPDDTPEPGRQGRASADEVGAADLTCNLEQIAHRPGGGGFKVFRFIDDNGVECGIYDSTLITGTTAIQNLNAGNDPVGVYVLDMTDPANPVPTATLVTPAMLSPHESLVLNERRGLLAAVLGQVATYPGQLDIYDLNADCRNPTLVSSTPTAFLGHESGFAPDGNTLWAASLVTGDVAAVDVSDPALPVTLWTSDLSSHGVTVSEDGNRAYFTALNVEGRPISNFGIQPGLQIMDTSVIQDRTVGLLPALGPQPEIIGTLEWEPAGVPQIAIPITIDGHPYLVEVDEFTGLANLGIPAGGGDLPGAARIIDIADDTNPRLVSNIRLEVHEPEWFRENQGADPNTVGPLHYTAHYCSVPQPDDPGLLGCSMIGSGLRVFDISDPTAPREVAYFNPVGDGSSSFAMSAPAWAPERNEIWYADAFKGLYVLRFTNGVWGSPGGPTGGGDGGTGGGGQADGGSGLPGTGWPLPVGIGLAALLGAGAVRRRARKA